jgi:hypothetical protein
LLWSFTIVGIGFIARSLLANNNLQLALVIGGAGAIGAALGFLLAARLHERVRSSANLVLAASMITGVMIAVTGGFRSKPSIAVVAFFLGLGFFLTKISLDTMVQEALGDDFRGRAFSLYDISYNLAWVVAAGAMEIVWGRVSGGLLIAGMGVVFLAGIAGIAAWFKRAGLLTPRSVTIEAR